jgi:hypothetical protein
MKINFAQYMSLDLIVVEAFLIEKLECFVVKLPDAFMMQMET